jgi:hypothetical protein
MSPSVTDLSRIAREVTAPRRSSDAPTALRLICAAPTLSRGNCETAYALPPRAMNIAPVAMALA